MAVAASVELSSHSIRDTLHRNKRKISGGDTADIIRGEVGGKKWQRLWNLDWTVFLCWENVKRQKTSVIRICVLLNCVSMWPDSLNCVVVCIVLIKPRCFSHFSLPRFFFLLLLLWDDDELWQSDVCVCLVVCTPTHTTEQRLDATVALLFSLCVPPSNFSICLFQ